MIYETKALALLKRAEYERSSGNLLLNTATWPSTTSSCTFSVGDFSGSILGTLRNDYRELWLFPLDKLQLNPFISCFRTVNKYIALTWSFICTHFLPLKLSYNFLDPLPFLISECSRQHFFGSHFCLFLLSCLSHCINGLILFSPLLKTKRILEH